jgi:K+-sensing histidine kinase KdpD
MTNSNQKTQEYLAALRKFRLTQHATWVRYSFAFGLGFLAIQLQLILQKLIPAPPYLLLFPVIFVTAVVAGFGPALMSILVSGLAADYFFIEPLGSFGLLQRDGLISYLIFCLSGVFAISLLKRLQLAEEALAQHLSVVAESEERFRLLADTAPVLVWISNTEKLCTWFNKGW